MTDPKCLWCGKPIRKHTVIVRAETHPNTYAPVKDWTYRGNQQVLARRYLYVDPENESLVNDYTKTDDPERWARREKRLCEVHVWDGETYLPVAGAFDKGPCVHKFAMAAVRAGFRRNKSQPT